MVKKEKLKTITLDTLLKNNSIDGVIYEKTSKLLNSNIFVNNKLTKKLEKKLKVR